MALKEASLLPAVKWRYLELTDPRFPLGNKRFPSVTATDITAAGQRKVRKSQTWATRGGHTAFLSAEFCIDGKHELDSTKNCTHLFTGWSQIALLQTALTWVCTHHSFSPWVRLRQPTGDPHTLTFEWQTIPVKHSPLRNLHCYQPEMRGFPALWQQHHADRETLFSKRLSTMQGDSGSCIAPRIKLAFSESSKVQPYKNWPTHTLGNLPITHNSSIFLIKHKR